MKTLVSFWRLAFLTLLVAQLLSSCMTDDGQTNKQVAANATPSSTSTLESGNGDYRLAPRDILQITVFQVQDLNNVIQVNEDGTITLALVGKIRVSGQTTHEAEQTIASHLRRYVQSPQVSISVKEFGKRITVNGEVKQPRVLADDGNTTLSQAVANAGGFTELANSSRVHIARSRNGHVQDELYNLDEIQGGRGTDPLLKGGDIVVVESSTAKVGFKTVSSLLPFAVLAALF